MAVKKKPKPDSPVWLIKCDGLCIDRAGTEAQAKLKKKEWEKLYPTYMKFDIVPLR